VLLEDEHILLWRSRLKNAIEPESEIGGALPMYFDNHCTNNCGG